MIVWFNRKTPIQTPLGAIRNFDGLARSRPNPGQIGEIQKHHFSYGLAKRIQQRNNLVGSDTWRVGCSADNPSLMEITAVLWHAIMWTRRGADGSRALRSEIVRNASLERIQVAMQSNFAILLIGG